MVKYRHRKKAVEQYKEERAVSKKNDNGKLEVFAWIADPKQAQAVTEEEIEHFRSVIGKSLAIERRPDGALVLYTSDESSRQRLDAVMRVMGLFREQKIYVDQNDE